MKKCVYCGAEMSDDSLFCTECGKELPKGNKCPHCGADINEGDSFCHNCGKKIAEETVPTSSMHSHDCDASRDDVEVQVNGINGIEEYNYSVDDETRTWRGLILYIVGAVVIIGVLGAIIWNYYSSSQRAERNIALADSLEKVRQDSVLQVRQQEKAKQDSIYKVQQEEKEFLENFYKNLNYSEWEILSYYIRKNVTSNALQTLREEYNYDCDDGDCLALWLFSYEAGGDMDKLIERKIEAVSENTFLVTNTWGYSDGPATRCDYKVKLGIVKEGDSYKIDTIVNLMEEEREKTYRENSNQYSKYVGRWILRKTTDEGQKMLIEVILKENHNGEFSVFHDRGSVQDVIAYEVYTQCILSDGTIYMTKDGDINKDVPKLRVASDGLYSFDGGKYEKQNE
jgi:hypothetical protein